MIAYVSLLFLLSVSAKILPATVSHDLIESVEISPHTITVVPTGACAQRYLKESPFVLSYDSSVDLTGLDKTVAAIPFVLCIAPLVWVSGEEYIVDVMDADLYQTLECIKRVFRAFYPQLPWNGMLHAKTLKKNRINRADTDEKAALLYSGGVDSTAAAYALNDQRLLLCTVRGIDVSINQEKDALWNRVYRGTVQFADMHGHDHTSVSFNFGRQMNYELLKELPGAPGKWWWWDYILGSLAFVGTTMPLLHHMGYEKIYVASSNTVAFPYPYNSHPLIDNNICCAGVSAHHFQDDVTRLEKVQRIAEYRRCHNLGSPFLRVCWSDGQGGNCSRCEKCLCTIHELLVVGEDPHNYGFAITFDDLKKRVEALFEASRTYETGILLDWRDAQEYARRCLIENMFAYDQTIRDYLSWFCTIDLGKHKISETFLENKDLFTQLWRLGQQIPALVVIK